MFQGSGQCGVSMGFMLVFWSKDKMRLSATIVQDWCFQQTLVRVLFAFLPQLDHLCLVTQCSSIYARRFNGGCKKGRLSTGLLEWFWAPASKWGRNYSAFTFSSFVCTLLVETKAAQHSGHLLQVRHVRKLVLTQSLMSMDE